MSTQAFFKDYAEALLSYKADKIASFYEVPMTVYSDEGVQQVTKMEEVEGFWKEGIKPYQAAGVTRAVPEIISEEQLSKSITICKVLWKNYEEDSKEAGEETNFYILHGTGDKLKICGLIMITQ